MSWKRKAQFLARAIVRMENGPFTYHVSDKALILARKISKRKA